MKNLYTLFLTSCLATLSLAADAAHPFSPFDDEDLRRYGAESQFDGVHALIFKDNQRCSTVAIPNLSYATYLTSRSCIEYHGRPTLMRGDKVVASAYACFSSPPGKTKPQYDIAICYFPKIAQSSLTYPLYTGELDPLLTQPLIHVGYGRVESKQYYPRQAFTTTVRKNSLWLEPTNRNTIPSEQPSGMVTEGDSGGGLFWKDPEEQLHLVGIADRGGAPARRVREPHYYDSLP